MPVDELHHRVHAKNLDLKIGFKSSKIENKLLQKYRAYDQRKDQSNQKSHYEGTQTWIGLHPQVLQTSYNEIYNAMIELKDVDIKKIIDIGAGYGRVGIVAKALFPTCHFVGYEILRKRQIEANRVFDLLELENCRVEFQDVLNNSFHIEKADAYFLYDFSESEDICIILDQLKHLSEKNVFYIITKGDRIDHLMMNRYKLSWPVCHMVQGSDLRIYSSTRAN